MITIESIGQPLQNGSALKDLGWAKSLDKLDWDIQNGPPEYGWKQAIDKAAIALCRAIFEARRQ